MDELGDFQKKKKQDPDKGLPASILLGGTTIGGEFKICFLISFCDIKASTLVCKNAIYQS